MFNIPQGFLKIKICPWLHNTKLSLIDPPQSDLVFRRSTIRKSGLQTMVKNEALENPGRRQRRITSILLPRKL